MSDEGVFKKSKVETLREGLQIDLNDPDLSPQDKAHYEKLLKWEMGGFDLRTHINDPKTGALICYQPYRREVVDGQVTYYRKVNGVERRFSEQGKSLDPVPEVKPQEKMKHGDSRIPR